MMDGNVYKDLLLEFWLCELQRYKTTLAGCTLFTRQITQTKPYLPCSTVASCSSITLFSKRNGSLTCPFPLVALGMTQRHAICPKRNATSKTYISFGEESIRNQTAMCVECDAILKLHVLVPFNFQSYAYTALNNSFWMHRTWKHSYMNWMVSASFAQR